MKLNNVLSYVLLVLSVLYSINACFVVHYVLYFNDIPMKYFLQISQNSSFPYIVHLNQPLNLPNNRTFSREITPVQMSDIKKVQTIYNYGGLYLDNDQFINYECIKKHICNLTGLYFLDWTFKQRWQKSVPLSFIYSSHPYNQTLLKSLQGLNESKTGEEGPRTVYFSGPFHMQQFRSGMSFVKIPKNCQFHRADRTWITQKPPNQQAYQNRVQRSILSHYNQLQKNSKSKYTKLWYTFTVIYPKDFDIRIQHKMEVSYNHVEMLDKAKVIIRVIRYSNNTQIRKLLQQFIKDMNYSKEDMLLINSKIYQNNTNVNDNSNQNSKISSNYQNPNTNTNVNVNYNYNININNNTNTNNNNSINNNNNLNNTKDNIDTNNINKNHHSNNKSNLNNNNNNENLTKKAEQQKKHINQLLKIKKQKQQKHQKQKQKQKQKQIDKNMLIYIISNFYIIFIAIVIIVVMIAILIHRYTMCCRNNNYEQSSNSSRVNSRKYSNCSTSSFNKTQMHQLQQYNQNGHHPIESGTILQTSHDIMSHQDSQSNQLAYQMQQWQHNNNNNNNNDNNNNHNNDDNDNDKVDRANQDQQYYVQYAKQQENKHSEQTLNN